jgi:hypothetical protein
MAAWSFMAGFLAFAGALYLGIARARLVGQGPLRSNDRLGMSLAAFMLVSSITLPPVLWRNAGHALLECAKAREQTWKLCNAPAEHYDGEMRKALVNELEKMRWPISLFFK